MTCASRPRHTAISTASDRGSSGSRSIGNRARPCSAGDHRSTPCGSSSRIRFTSLLPRLSRHPVELASRRSAESSTRHTALRVAHRGAALGPGSRQVRPPARHAARRRTPGHRSECRPSERGACLDMQGMPRRLPRASRRASPTARARCRCSPTCCAEGRLGEVEVDALLRQRRVGREPDQRAAGASKPSASVATPSAASGNERQMVRFS
jgi:hypothetical protein